MLLDRNLGNSAIAVLDAMADADEDRAEADAQRRADEQRHLEFLARQWLQHLATPAELDENLESPACRELLGAVLDLVRGKVVSLVDLHQLQRRVTTALMPAALEATREPR